MTFGLGKIHGPYTFAHGLSFPYFMTKDDSRMMELVSLRCCKVSVQEDYPPYTQTHTSPPPTPTNNF